MLDKIANILQQECKLQAKDLLVVGVSGGPDSLCLLHVLHKLDYQLIVVHINHQLRPEAAEEALIVEGFAEKLGIEFQTCVIDVNSFAKENSLSIEEAARKVRYQYLFSIAEKFNARSVAVGHNADDQVETILMHLLRGSGTAGLRGMDFSTLPNPWSEHIPLHRPLLTTWREDILKYLNENKITPVTDRSNFDKSYVRNRIRHELLPTLTDYNPRIRENLLRSGEIMRDDYSLIQKMVQDEWEKVRVRQGQGYLALSRPSFIGLPRSIQRNLMRKAIAFFLPGLMDVDFDCVERAIIFLSTSKPHGESNLSDGVSLIRDGDLIWITSYQDGTPTPDLPVMNPGEISQIIIPSQLALNYRWQLIAENVIDFSLATQQSFSNPDPFQAWLDIDQLELPLTIRSRRIGDSIRPLGMSGHSMKISDVMINLKLPRKARKNWPLVCCGEQVIWIPGYRQSLCGQVKPDSTRIIHLTLFRNLAA